MIKIETLTLNTGTVLFTMFVIEYKMNENGDFKKKEIT
jgi:hypothetical protein